MCRSKKPNTTILQNIAGHREVLSTYMDFFSFFLDLGRQIYFRLQRQHFNSLGLETNSHLIDPITVENHEYPTKCS